MQAAPLKEKLETVLGRPVFSFREKPKPETISTGIVEVDAECGGLPRGAITEIVGQASSGRTTLLYSILAEMTQAGEACALVDVSDAFNPVSAAACGVDLQRLLWVRFSNQYPRHKNNVLRVTDLLLQNGGWGIIVLDLGDLHPKDGRRIPLNAWHRFRLAVENKLTVFLVIGQQPYATSCSALLLETGTTRTCWEGLLFRGAFFETTPRKPPGRMAAKFEAAALACGTSLGVGLIS
jgi:hypothetical protein